MEKLLLIDGNSLLNRAFYAFGGGGAFLSYNGAPTNATYGFLNMLIKGLEDIKPTHVVVAFDVKAKTFRHEMYDGYKAHRGGMPDDLAVQLPILKELLAALGYKIIELESYEADDILGTIARAAAERNVSCVVATGDKDSFQLVGGSTTVRLAFTKGGRAQSEHIYVVACGAECEWGEKCGV